MTIEWQQLLHANFFMFTFNSNWRTKLFSHSDQYVVIWNCVTDYSEFIRSNEQSTKIKLKNSKIVIKMKGFQRTQAYLAVIGLTPSHRRWNIRQICCLFVYSTGMISFGVNIFVGANNVQESMESFYVTRTVFWVSPATFLTTINSSRCLRILKRS